MKDLTVSRKFINPFDFFIIFLIVFVAVILVTMNGGEPEMLRVKDNNGITLYSLRYDRVIIPAVKYKEKIEIKNKRVRVIDSSCPLHICEGMGWIDKCGDSIICVPNRMVITVIGDRGVDAVTQ